MWIQIDLPSLIITGKTIIKASTIPIKNQIGLTDSTSKAAIKKGNSVITTIG
jgi:hypothetical protein